MVSLQHAEKYFIQGPSAHAASVNTDHMVQLNQNILYYKFFLQFMTHSTFFTTCRPGTQKPFISHMQQSLK